jgi:hypothetical protein
VPAVATGAAGFLAASSFPWIIAIIASDLPKHILFLLV